MHTYIHTYRGKEEIKSNLIGFDVDWTYSLLGIYYQWRHWSFLLNLHWPDLIQEEEEEGEQEQEPIKLDTIILWLLYLLVLWSASLLGPTSRPFNGAY